MVRTWCVLAVFAAVGCSARIGAGSNAGDDDDTALDIDASVQNIDAAPATLVDAAPACASGRVLYLNFEGATLTDAPSDATLNHASWIINGTSNPHAPPTARSAADQLAITTGVRTQLAAFPITVVTTRPAAGPYVMVVYGGAPGNVGSRFTQAVQELDCGDVSKSDVAWIADGGTVQRAVNYTIGAIGFGLGLTATSTPGDCMCGWDNACTPNNDVPCALATAIPRDLAAHQTCPGLTTQDEVAAFQTGFCQ